MINFREKDIDCIIEMDWEVRNHFDAIKFQYIISEEEVIEIMRREMKLSSLKCGENVYKVELPSNKNYECLI